MKQVILYIEPSRHSELKQEAKLHRRTIGQQLIVRAFGIGLPKPTTKKKGAK